jgi:diguanylate cyclase (GGDEF)-like protein
MPQTPLKEAVSLCSQLRHIIEKEKIFLPVESFKPVKASVTISAGVAVLTENVHNETDLIACADEMLYRAKEKGRNRVES